MNTFSRIEKHRLNRLGLNQKTVFYILVFGFFAVLSFALLQVKTSYASGQPALTGGNVNLYENPATGEVFLKSGAGRIKIGKKMTDKLFKTQSAKSSLIPSMPSWLKNIQLHALIYMGYGYFTNTGFSGQMQLEEEPPATGNNGYNAFNVNRGYLIFIYQPNKNWFLKITPNIVKTSNSGITGGSEFYRLKYAFVQFNHVYNANGLTTNIKAGQFPTPMVAWEDGLLGYHFVERTPWGFLGVTSTQAGLGVSGKFRNDGKIYLAYNAGIFNNAAFHNSEEADQKSPQVRLSYYPFGAASNLNGLGVSGYYSWGMNDGSFEPSVSDASSSNLPVTRASLILNYKTDRYNIVLQYDYARNLTYPLGGGPASFGNSEDAGSACSPIGVYSTSEPNTTCNSNGSLPFNVGLPSSVTGAISNNTEHGVDAFGYYNITNKIGVFGLIQDWFMQPNAGFSYASNGTSNVYESPYNFQRLVIGVGYKLNNNIQLALDDQNFRFLNDSAYRNAPETSPAYINYGQWMGDTNAIFLNARIAF